MKAKYVAEGCNPYTAHDQALITVKQLVAETEYVREEARPDVQAAKKAKDAAAERVADVQKRDEAARGQEAALRKREEEVERLESLRQLREAEARHAAPQSMSESEPFSSLVSSSISLSSTWEPAGIQGL